MAESMEITDQEKHTPRSTNQTKSNVKEITRSKGNRLLVHRPSYTDSTHEDVNQRKNFLFLSNSSNLKSKRGNKIDERQNVVINEYNTTKEDITLGTCEKLIHVNSRYVNKYRRNTNKKESNDIDVERNSNKMKSNAENTATNNHYNNNKQIKSSQIRDSENVNLDENEINKPTHARRNFKLKSNLRMKPENESNVETKESNQQIKYVTKPHQVKNDLVLQCNSSYTIIKDNGKQLDNNQTQTLKKLDIVNNPTNDCCLTNFERVYSSQGNKNDKVKVKPNTKNSENKTIPKQDDLPSKANTVDEELDNKDTKSKDNEENKYQDKKVCRKNKCVAEMGGYTTQFGLKPKPNDGKLEGNTKIKPQNEREFNKGSSCNCVKMCGCKNILNPKEKSKQPESNKTDTLDDNTDKSTSDVAIDINLPIGQIYKIKAPNIFDVIINNKSQSQNDESKNGSTNKPTGTKKKEDKIMTKGSNEILTPRNRSKFQRVIHPKQSKLSKRQHRDNQIQKYNRYLKSILNYEPEEDTESINADEVDEEEIENLSLSDFSFIKQGNSKERLGKPRYWDQDNIFSDESVHNNKGKSINLRVNRFQEINTDLPPKENAPRQIVKSEISKKNYHEEDENIKNKLDNITKGKQKSEKNNLIPNCKEQKVNLDDLEYKMEDYRNSPYYETFRNNDELLDSSSDSFITDDKRKNKATFDIMFSTTNRNIIDNLVSNEELKRKKQEVIVFSQLSYNPSQNNTSSKGVTYHETKITEKKRIKISNTKEGFFKRLKSKLFSSKSKTIL